MNPSGLDFLLQPVLVDIDVAQLHLELLVLFYKEPDHLKVVTQDR